MTSAEYRALPELIQRKQLLRLMGTGPDLLDAVTKEVRRMDEEVLPGRIGAIRLGRPSRQRKARRYWRKLDIGRFLGVT